VFDRRPGVSADAGNLTICRKGADNPLWMIGPAVTVLEGDMEIDES
jgi:diaminopimelate epimerase